MLIPILPEILKNVLDAPFPYIIGVKKPIKEKWNLLEASGSTLIVLLDSGEIIQKEESTINTFPDLENSIEIKKGYKNFARNFYEFNYGRISQYPTLEQLAATNIIFNSVESILKANILNKIPKSNNLEEIKSAIKLQSTNENKSFIEKFIETQMFVVYAENLFIP